MTDAAASPAPQGDRFFSTLFAAAWMAIVLGLLVQLAVFGAKLGAGANVPGLQFMVDIASGIAWAVIVCGGVAIGTVAARGAPQFMGVLGLISAPLAFAAAKGVQRGVAWMLGQPMEQITTLTYQIGIAKTVEYGLLGMVLGMLIRTPRSTFATHALIGAGFGAVFACVILWLNMQGLAAGASLPAPRIAATTANEFIFPLGCSLVIYWIARLSDHAAARERLMSGGS